MLISIYSTTYNLVLGSYYFSKLIRIKNKENKCRVVETFHVGQSFNIKLFQMALRKLVLILVVLSSLKGYSQDTAFIKNNDKAPVIADSIFQHPSPAPKKRFWRASGELMVAELVPWSYNYFVRGADFAKIGWSSIGHNLKLSSWEWDDNNFTTNQFAHPYHGNLYFSAFRTNGYSFWQAAPAAVAGSLIWEIAGETHPPSPNDFINTSMGGIALGEMTYRLSNLIVNNRQTGFKRQANEVLAFLVNPMNGLNRIIDGKWGKLMDNPADRMPSSFGGELDFGARRYSEKSEDLVSKGKNEMYFRLRLQYGNPFVDRKQPFSNFSLVVEGGNNDSAKINTLRVVGFLHGWKTGDTETSQKVINITASFDYFHNSAFYYGAQSINAGLLSRYKMGNKTTLETQIGTGLIVLAAVQDEYLYYGEGRNYDYGPGVNLFADVSLLTAEKLLLAVHYRGGWFSTLNGNPSTHLLSTIASELRYLFTKNISLGTEWGHLNLKGYYKDFKNVSKSYPYLRISAGYTF